MSDPTQTPKKKSYLLSNGKLLEPTVNELFSGWKPTEDFEVITGHPKFTWRGGKIPFSLWSEIVCFMRWSQKEIKEESMLFLFYHPAEKKWAAWVFPQNPNGMSVRMLEKHSMYTEDRQQFGKGWIQAGTVHHHCNAGAFQSSTDKTDEEDRDGIHITLGKMEERTIDIHCRQVFGGVQTDALITDWVGLPEWLTAAPEQYRKEFGEYLCIAVKDHPYPKEWESRVFKHIWQAEQCDKNYRGPPVPGFRESAENVGGATTPKKTTMLGNSISGTKNTESSSNPLHDSWDKQWQEDKKRRTREVLRRLNIDAQQAYYLIDATISDPELIAQKNSLREGLIKEGVLLIYASDIFFDLWEESNDNTPVPVH